MVCSRSGLTCQCSRGTIQSSSPIYSRVLRTVSSTRYGLFDCVYLELTSKAFDSRLRIDRNRPINVCAEPRILSSNALLGWWVWCRLVWLYFWSRLWGRTLYLYECNACTWWSHDQCTRVNLTFAPQAWNNINLHRIAEKVKSPLVLYVQDSKQAFSNTSKWTCASIHCRCTQWN